MSADSRIAVTIVTGFLGAGKTTLIFRLVSARQRERIGVIVGDGLDSAIDSELLAEVVDAIDSVCASSAGAMHIVRALERMHRLMPALDRIVVETGGLDDPASLLDAIGRDVSFAHVEGVIALADAAEPLGDHDGLAWRQLELGTHIILSKADLVSSGELSALRARVRALNPGAEILAASGHILDCGLLLDRLSSIGSQGNAPWCASAPIRRRATRGLAGPAQPAVARRRSSKF